MWIKEINIGVNMYNVYFGDIIRQLKRIADALEESNKMIKDLGDK